MRSAFARPLPGMNVFSILVADLAFANLVSAQSGTVSKRKFRQHTLHLQLAAPSVRSKAPQPVTTDTWTGGGGGSNTNRSDNSNWNNSAPSGQIALIGLTTAPTVEDDNTSIGTLTMSHAGDSVAVAKQSSSDGAWQHQKAGTISLGSIGNNTFLDLGASLTFNGTGTVVLGSGGPNYICSVGASAGNGHLALIQGWDTDKTPRPTASAVSHPVRLKRFRTLPHYSREPGEIRVRADARCCAPALVPCPVFPTICSKPNNFTERATRRLYGPR